MKCCDLASVSPSPLGDHYLEIFERILKLANRKDIRVVFLFAPHKGYHYGRYRAFRDLLDGRGVNYIDLIADFDLAGIDNANDFYDPGHLNFYGAKKASRYIARYLTEKIGVVSTLTAEEKTKWDGMVKDYEDKCQALIRKTTKKK